MKKDYVLDHNWGSFNTRDAINRLLLRNTDDFISYFENEMQNPQYIAERIDKYKFKFQDGTVIEYIIEIYV